MKANGTDGLSGFVDDLNSLTAGQMAAPSVRQVYNAVLSTRLETAHPIDRPHLPSCLLFRKASNESSVD